MDLKVDAIAKARANVERALAKPDKALSNALQASSTFLADALAEAQEAGVPPSLIAEPTMFAQMVVGYLEKANRAQAWLHYTLHQTVKKLDPNPEPTPQGGGGDGKGDTKPPPVE